MKLVRSWLLTVLVCALMAAPAFAQSAGVRVGVSGDPSQFYFGGHYESAPFADQLRFRPNLEIGVGDNHTLTAVNFEFAYFVPLQRRNPWSVYFGAGPALVIDHVTNNTDTGGGFNILVGLQHSQGFFTEVKVGMIDSPSFKFGVGYTFRP
ncbi:MAG TPA: hypothetical protein VLV86_17910 [Vicinamibacterales bacterium]|nr:hypothetical protein [Vicinamibacterales bacterium]